MGNSDKPASTGYCDLSIKGKGQVEQITPCYLSHRQGCLFATMARTGEEENDMQGGREADRIET